MSHLSLCACQEVYPIEEEMVTFYLRGLLSVRKKLEAIQICLTINYAH